MEENRPKETQSELFPEQFSSGGVSRGERFPGIVRPQKQILLATNTEHLLMAGILGILVLCGVFFLGVVRGKALTGGIVEAPVSTGEPGPVAAPEPVPVRAPAQPAIAQARTNVQPAPRPTPTRAAQPAAEPAASKPYTIQIVTHRKKELADAEMNGLRAQGFYSFIIKSGEYYQVCAGQYGSKEEAKADLARFQSKFKDSFLRRR